MKTPSTILLVYLMSVSYFSESQVPVIVGENRELVAEAMATNRVPKESQGSLIALLDYLTREVLMGMAYGIDKLITLIEKNSD